MAEGPQISSTPVVAVSGWHRSLSNAIRDPAILVDRLRLPARYLEPAIRAAELFPLMVTESFLARMRTGDPGDPLLRQVLPLGSEFDEVPGFGIDPVGDSAARRAPGMLNKYKGRVLLIATGSCAVHCRYCFRRHYPYGEEPRRLDEWEPAMQVIAADSSVSEVILSGGDPLMLTDRRLEQLIARLAAIPHLRRLRIHSRLPVVLPDRVTSDLLKLMTDHPQLRPIMVVHANHPAEIAGDCGEALARISGFGIPTLNQTVLLRGINDQVAPLLELSERLVNLGVMPYYLHQLDAVSGTAHFAVSDRDAVSLVEQLRAALPGYAVPRLVRETPGDSAKRPIHIN